MTKKSEPIQEAILRQRGLRREKPIIDRPKRLSPSIPLPTFDAMKTSDMRLIELRYGIRIEKLLLSGSLNYICEQIKHEVDRSTISRWKKKLMLNYTPEHLPECTNCPHSQDMCKLGVCALLLKLDLTNLIELKRSQILER